VVEEVAPDSPAAKVGIKQHDILLKAGNQPLEQIADLVRAIEKAKATKIALEAIREGKPIKIDVTPAKRPRHAGMVEGVPVPAPGNPDLEQLRKWVEKMEKAQPGAEGQPPMQFRFFQPGMILPPGAPMNAPLPEGMSVAVTKAGKEPAKIVVKKGDKTWEVTEKELDKLPKDVRPFVEQMLGRMPMGGGFGVHIGEQGPAAPMPFGPVPPDAPMVPGAAMPPGMMAPPMVVPHQDRGIQERLDKMSRQIDELKKAIDELQGKKAPKNKEPHPKHAEK
jgi:hypothetical protein